VQRAFAAELLCPFEALEEKLAGDLSADAREDAARYFNVSERAVTTVLVNNHRLDRDYLEYVEELAV
jgi:Zn-dependent peptidase ImmA (M78 family)